MSKTNMTRQLTSIATALAFSCGVTNVMADSYVGSKPNDDAPELWSGPYFGMYFGGGAGYIDTSYSSTVDSTVQPTTVQHLSTVGQLDNRGLTGSVADLFIGYNYHRNNTKLLAGAQLEGSVFSDITMKSSNILETITVANTGTTYTDNGVYTKYDLSSMLSIIGRAGILLNQIR